LLLGAGGAAHGVAPTLIDAGIGDLFIVNRNPEKADALADSLGRPGRVHSRYWKDLSTLGAFDFIINATSAGREQSSMSLPFGIATPRSQAAESFLLWHAVRPQTQAIFAELHSRSAALVTGD
jgi:shikimate dehydrogenase